MGEPQWSCLSLQHGNYIVTMNGWYYLGVGVDYGTDTMKRAFLHEVFHSYNAEHVSGSSWIMYYKVSISNWNLHSTTKTSVTINIKHFDGVIEEE